LFDERDLGQEKRWYHEQLAKRCLKALERNNIGARYAQDRDEARSIVLSLIPEGATVGMGDSVTFLQAGITQEIETRWGDRVFNPFHVGPEGVYALSGRDPINLMRQAASADVFLTGMNAITLDGKLVNTDGFGNRVGGLVFGPRKVIVVSGANKIVPNLDEAFKRIRNIAAPINARRHHLKHGMDQSPCAVTGECTDCRHLARNCSFTLIVEFQRPPRAGREPRITVVLIAEEMGI
jgi:hypothetical protein